MRLDHPYHHTKNCDSMGAGKCYPCANVELTNANASLAEKVKELDRAHSIALKKADDWFLKCAHAENKVLELEERLKIKGTLLVDAENAAAGATLRADEFKSDGEKVREAHDRTIKAAAERERVLREAVEDCARYFDYASRKHVLPEGATKAMTLCMRAMRIAHNAAPGNGCPFCNRELKSIAPGAICGPCQATPDSTPTPPAATEKP